MEMSLKKKQVNDKINKEDGDKKKKDAAEDNPYFHFFA